MNPDDLIYEPIKKPIDKPDTVITDRITNYVGGILKDMINKETSGYTSSGKRYVQTVDGQIIYI